MDYVVLNFVFLMMASGAEPTGYIVPLSVKNPPCGIVGEVVGVTYNKVHNPTEVYWTDPYFPGTHCKVDIQAELPRLQLGTYEFATTQIGLTAPFGTTLPPYTLIDPHVSLRWVRQAGDEPPPPPPTGIGVLGSGTQLPAARVLSWDANAPDQQIVGYIASQDGVDFAMTPGLTQPVTLTAYKSYTFSVKAVNVDNKVSDPATITYALQAPTCQKPTIRVDDWTKSVPVGGRGKVQLTLLHSYMITRLQVKLGGQVIGEVTGTDLRDLSGLYFSVPRTPGTYNITVAVTDVLGCSEQTTAVRQVVVQ